MPTPAGLAAADKRRILDPPGTLYTALVADGRLIRAAQQGADDVAAEAGELRAPIEGARSEAGPLSNIRRGAETDKSQAVQGVVDARPERENREIGDVLVQRGAVSSAADGVSRNANDPDVTTEQIDFENANRVAEQEVEDGISTPVRDAPPDADDPDFEI